MIEMPSVLGKIAICRCAANANGVSAVIDAVEEEVVRIIRHCRRVLRVGEVRPI